MNREIRALPTLATLAAVTLLLPAALPAQSSLSGEVIGEDGKPVEGAMIALDRVNVEKHFEVTTDQKGRYFIGGLHPAFYKVVLSIRRPAGSQLPGVQNQAGKREQVGLRPGRNQKVGAGPVE